MSDATRPLPAQAARDMGGRDWVPAKGHPRVYLNADVWAPLVALEVDRYKSGNVRSATLAGEHISNAEATRILAARVYVVNGQLHVTDWTARRLTADALADAIVAEAEERRSAQAAGDTAHGMIVDGLRVTFRRAADGTVTAPGVVPFASTSLDDARDTIRGLYSKATMQDDAS